MQKSPHETTSVPNPFQSTMRIDIPPEALAAAAAETPARRPPAQPVIKIQRKKTETALLGSSDFQDLLQNIYDGVLITDLAGHILNTNLRAHQFFQREASELRHLTVYDLISGADQALLPTIWETLQSDRFVLIQAFCPRKDGALFPAEISVNRLRLAGQDYLNFFVRDVTLRKQQEERLRTGFTAIQNASSGIGIADAQAALEYGNPAFLKLVGLPDLAAAQGRNLREFLGDPALAEELLATIHRGETWFGELEMKPAEGAAFCGQASVTANLNEEGEPIGLVISLLDITPQKRAQLQLEGYAQALHEKNAQMQDDLNMAKELHLAFLPHDFRQFPRPVPPEQAAVQFHHLYHPSGTIGGDFFDLRSISGHEVGVFIADVMGHGMRSALVVAILRGLLEQLAPLAGDPGALLTQLNRTYMSIFRQMGGDVTFATAFYAVLDVATGRLRYANAGHPQPVLLQRPRAAASFLPLPPGQATGALGLFEDHVFRNADCVLAPEEVVLFYTDGLSEVEGAGREYYQTERLWQTLRAEMQRPPAELLDRLLADAREFSGAPAFEDDICLLALEFLRLRPA